MLGMKVTAVDCSVPELGANLVMVLWLFFNLCPPSCGKHETLHSFVRRVKLLRLFPWPSTVLFNDMNRSFVKLSQNHSIKLSLKLHLFSLWE